MNKILIAGFLVLTFVGCFKEEEPMVLPEFGEGSRIETIEMGSDYEGQYFFDLGTGQLVSSNPKTAWDLAFECEAGTYRIWLNGAKTMRVARASTKELDRAVDLSLLEWSYDGPSGSPDSNAIGAWGDFSGSEPVSFKDVFVIDRGEDAQGNHLGYRKVQLLRFFENAYEFHYVNLDGTGYQSVGVLKNDQYNFSYFSFDENTTVDIAPFRMDWDIVFTRYTHLFHLPTLTPYQVTGVLINPYMVEVAQPTNIAFDDVTLDDAANVAYANEWNVIGYNWKSVDINSGLFTVNIDQTYIIKDVAGDHYKLRFIDFYDDRGNKGYPKFEYQKL